jgi:5,10-methylenetetrahydromethanopterin reductase
VLEHVATLLPDEWLEPAATGDAARCAARVLRQFDRGVDGVIMHGATPTELAPVVDAYRSIRPAGRFDGWPANPGRPRE